MEELITQEPKAEENWEWSLSTPLAHQVNDTRSKAILALKSKVGTLTVSHFRILRKIGNGDLGIVYAAELEGCKRLFALKVMEAVPSDDDPLGDRRKKRAMREKEILNMLDHPFLPTLYASFHDKNTYSVVMEFCPGRSLNNLRQRQHNKRFDFVSARFYAAEILLALEYLHMKGILYRDLKPENVLLREDGHIMLSDFDLSVICDKVIPTIVPSVGEPTTRSISGIFRQHLCFGGMSKVYCSSPCYEQVKEELVMSGTTTSKAKKKTPEVAFELSTRSNSLVGTYEFLAPEVICRCGHTSAIDWWALGVLLYEMLYGKTPFKGGNDFRTMENILKRPLTFDNNIPVSNEAKNLLKGLLVKDPKRRTGSCRGAAEIKQHKFFTGINWALVRATRAPWIPSHEKNNVQGKSIRMEYF